MADDNAYQDALQRITSVIELFQYQKKAFTIPKHSGVQTRDTRIRHYSPNFAFIRSYTR